MRDGYNKTPSLLGHMPGSACEVAAWFETLTDRAFDTVCVSAVTMILREEQEETGFISATSIARCTRAMRERYRRMCNMAVHSNGQAKQLPGRVVGERSPHAKLNEMQVRIARRVDRRLGSKDLAEMFGVSTSTLHRARIGESWRHLTNGFGRE